MLWKCCTQYASKFGKLSSGHRTGKGQFSFQSQRRAMPNNVLSVKMKVLVAQLFLTLCNPMDCSPPGSSVHGILQARTLEWVAIPFSRGSSQPRDQTHFSCIAGRIFTTARPEKPLSFHQQGLKTLLKDRHQKMNLSIKENFILHKDPGKLHKGSVI